MHGCFSQSRHPDIDWNLNAGSAAKSSCLQSALFSIPTKQIGGGMEEMAALGWNLVGDYPAQCRSVARAH